MNTENELAFKEHLLYKNYKNHQGVSMNLHETKGGKVLFFLSVFCIRCLELIPEIIKMSDDVPNTTIFIFSNGTEKDHQEMESIFPLGVNIIGLNDEEMEEEYSVSLHPYYFLVDKNNIVYSKGNIKSIDHIKERINIER
ncbi:hypothetical protein HQN87_08950 [Paenibacillus tritici]|uniref:TlpA family protein disulfide reductase n=1 Tax=Paenibacillus tritici TaxID=1873425 RepID=A0ABX2DLW4_9BACL|nr:hypothetical protein [Paenibacillus tritici]NQX45455.1 hypothetical protein [Paenibacillus tritici]